ncbi:dTDP-4-dehydrorhamnose reductase [Vibrio metschnikovii]|uniref:dTDP-4-dehydrorhamnose reductase n=1 Tax=Vibrio metschnikovii TaxID=28172 RepID=UPI001C2FBE51|nr:dTDP-4-dehydrorhamnose reductase [Vibrio metschnikovii]
MIKVVITGSQGQVGRALVRLFEQQATIQLYAYNRAEIDITDQQQLDRVFDQVRPDIVINAAAYTAVDKAENDLEACNAVNHQAVKYLALAAQRHQALLIHISTDYVYDGTKAEPYLESDRPNPQSVYGLSKLAGEQAIQACCNNYMIIRTAWVFAEQGSNFVRTMLKLAKTRSELSIVGDQYGGPTYAGDLAQALVSIVCSYIQTGNCQSGIYHYSGLPHTSWYGFAEAIFNKAQQQGVLEKRPVIHAITTQQYPTPAKRPANSRLDGSLIERQFSVTPSDWQQALNNLSVYLNEDY